MSSRESLDQKYEEWKEQSRVELKQKIRHNYNERLKASIKTINKSLNKYFPNSKVSIFNISDQDINTALQQFYQRVNMWGGVDLSTVRGDITKWQFNAYHKRADNWWNRYKAAWIGDYLFHPLFNQQIDHFIKYNGCRYCAATAAEQSDDIKTDNLDHELLKYMLIRDIMHSLVKFERTRKMPLILDQSYTKSEYLQELFKEIGDKYGIEFKMPSNLSVKFIFTLREIFLLCCVTLHSFRARVPSNDCDVEMTVY